ncbi:tetratricopeptide repeat protein [Dactylosporangium sp. CA-092794]|uniref:tetratricopeptide repeat protein n=1 Tax=Dactylosporangium sp. CA-092794 TaxID=3239929 RepID=UPI003D8E6E01
MDHAHAGDRRRHREIRSTPSSTPSGPRPPSWSGSTRGWARTATGQPRPALTDYEQALTLNREAGDRGHTAATLNNIGAVYDGLGDRRQALVYYEQALPIRRQVGDRAGEAATRYNIATIHRAVGNLDEAISELERVLELDRQVDHPDLASDTALLDQIRQERATGPGTT